MYREGGALSPRVQALVLRQLSELERDCDTRQARQPRRMDEDLPRQDILSIELTEGILQDVDEVVDAGTFCSYVSYLISGSSVSFDNRRYFMNSSSQGAQERWQTAHLWPQQSEISKDDVKNGLFQLQSREEDAMVCCISGRDKVVSSVRLCLQSNQCIVLDETCNNLVFSDTNIMGGLLVASGPGCNIRLHNVKFQYSTLVVLDGASVEVDGALFNCSLDRGTGVSMFVHGPGSTVMAKDIKMEGGLQGVSVVHGGFLWGLNMECHGVEVSGLEAQGKGSKLLLQRCSVAGMGRKYSNADATPNDEGKVETFCSGVVLRNESAGLFSEVSVIKAETGLCAEYNSLIDAHDCKMAECLASGANVSNTSTAMFNKCVMHGSLFFHGLSVDGAGTHVTATDCMFARNKQSGAGVYGGGFMELRDCESEGNESSGFWAQGSGNLVLIDCTSHRDTTGCGACGKGSELVARRVTVSRSTRNGMDIFDEGSAELTDCAISECEGCGLLVIAEGKVHAEGCAFEHALTHHGIVVAGEKSTASANNCSLSRNKQSGAGVYDGGRLHLSHCTSEYNQHSGYWVQAGGQMTLSECESDHDRIGFGASGRHSMLLAMNSVVKRSTERGVQVFNQAASELVNCSILDSNFSGLVVVDGARVVAKGCTIKDARVRHGVEVSGEGSSAEATECYLMGNSEAGAGVFQSGRLTLNKCKAGGNGVAGYWTQSTGHLILNDCTSSGDSIGCGARGEGTQLRMAGGRVMCCSKNGILVDDGANGAVFGVHASLNDDSSFACSGPGTSMHVKCCASLDATPYSVRDGARMVCMDSVPPFESAFVPPEARLSSWPPIALVGHAINIA